MTSRNSFEYIDHVYRSRQTILRILSERGYNTKPYENFGPDEIEAMVFSAGGQEGSGGQALRMDLVRPADSTDSTITKCRVIYYMAKLKQRLPSFLRDLTDEENGDRVDPKTEEVVVMLATPEGEPVVDVYHIASYDQWINKKLRIFFFRIANLIIHPADHILVPKHERVPKAEIPFTVQERAKLPFIRFHEDMQARVLGLVPGEIVKITRPSPSSGEYTMYRICSP